MSAPVILTGIFNLLQVPPPKQKRMVGTPYGNVYAHYTQGCWVIPRHGKTGTTPPHAINHAANMTAAKMLGSIAIGLGSTGSLDKNIAPGALAVPDDILFPTGNDTICLPNERLHIVPAFDEDLRQLLIQELTSHGFEIVDGGIYAQTRGPRLESKAEITFLADYAHYVGMTCASELILACELGLPYALLVSVDNWGNGLLGERLKIEELNQGAARNRARVVAAVETLLPALIKYARRCAG